MRAIVLCTVLALAACAQPRGGDGVYAPGPAGGAAVDQLLVGHRLLEAGEGELALSAFRRAALRDGLTADVLSGLGSANLSLGRLNQAEDLLRRAVEADADFPEAWNNLGVVLMELGRTGEAVEVFRRAYATDDGQSDTIRDNLRMALAKLERPDYAPVNEDDEFRLMRRGRGDYLLSPAS